MRGYTRFTQEHGDEAASVLAGRFADLVREAVPEFEGELLELRGDETLCVFRSARQALRAAVELQRRLRTPTSEQAAFPIGVGMGLDAGEAVPTQGGYRGASLNLAARLCALAKPGEILATETVAHFAHRVDGLRLLEGRSAALKGMARPVRFVVVTPDEPLPPVPTAVVDRTRSRWLVWGVIAVLGLVLGAAVGLIFASAGPKSSAGLRGGVFAVVGQNGQASTPVSVGGGATGIAASGLTAWVPDYPTGQVLKVDTASGGSVPIAVGSGPDAVAVGANAVWVANAGDGTVSEVSPSAGKVVATIYVGNAPSGIVVADNAVWVTLSLDGAVAKIDPSSQRVVKRFAAGDDPTRIAFGGGKLWVTNESIGTVTPINPSTDKAESPIPVPGGPNGIVSGAGGVFVTNGVDGTVTRIDSQQARIAWTNQAGSDPQGVAVVGESLWVAAQGSGQIVRLDARTGAPQAPLNVGAEPLNLAAMGDRAAVTTTSVPAEHHGGTLTIASGPLATSIDPQSRWAWLAQPWQTFSMTNDGLVAFKRVPGPDGETVVADLATTLPTPTDSGRTYTFQLRRGIRYSTGKPVEASDIRYGIERSFTVNVGTNHEPNLGGTFYNNIVGAPACANRPTTCNLESGISTNDQTGTITFHLRRADPDFLAKLAMPMAVAVPLQVPPREMGTHPLPATGPYMVESYQPKTSAVLMRNPEFKQWSRDAQPSGYPNRIVWRVYKTGDQAALAVERGQADYLADEVSPSRLRQIQSVYTAQTHPSSALVTHFIVLAGSNTLRKDLTARQAIAYAVNRNTIVRLLGGPLAAQPTCQLLPPNFPGYRPYCPYTAGTDHTKWTAADPATAQLLAKRSKSYGKTIWVEPRQYASNYLVHLLTGLGFKARLDRKGNHDEVWMPSTGFGEDYPGADDFLGFYTNPANTPRDLKRTLNKQLQGQYAGTLAWAAADRRFARYLWVLPVATPQVLGFTARSVRNYLSAPVIENNPIIDQMWVR
jgi:ABC-type transport system substrate-binding protein